MCFLNVILIWFEKILIRFWYGSNVILIWFQDFLGFPVGWLEKNVLVNFPKISMILMWFDTILTWYAYQGWA